MIAKSVRRRLSTTLALAGWLGLAGFGEAAEIVARSLGTHGDCNMACCRDREDACARMAGGHHAAHRTHPAAADTSIAAPSSCVEACALLQGVGRSAVSAASTDEIAPVPTASRVVAATRTKLPTPRFLESLPARAPPA